MENKSAVPGARKAEDTARNMPEGESLLRLLADVSQNAAVNVQDEAVDEVGSGRGEEDGGTAQILGFAPAACGGLGDDEAVEGVTAAVGLTLAQRCGLRGGDVAGSDAVALMLYSPYSEAMFLVSIFRPPLAAA